MSAGGALMAEMALMPNPWNLMRVMPP